MSRDEIAVLLDKAVCEIDATARDNGHSPHPWAEDDAAAAHTACSACGHTAAVRVRAAGVWKAGSLVFSECGRKEGP
jgi:hypothetical protein